jgi:hypothetical protein
MNGVLLPAALHLIEAEETVRQAAGQALAEATLTHLRRRISDPLAPPADWQRPSAVACTCTYCVEEWNRNNTRSLKNEEQK